MGANWFVCKNSTATTFIQHLPLFFLPDTGLRAPLVPTLPQVSGEEDITPTSFLPFHLRIQGASHSSARSQAEADWCHSLMASILNCWMQPRSCVFLTQQQSSWTTALHCPGLTGLPTESARQCAAHPSKALLGANTRGELCLEKLSLPHTPLQGSFLQENLKRFNKEHFQSTGMLVGLFWDKLQLLTTSM